MTLIDSDDKPLSRVREGRNVLPRIETEMSRIVHPLLEESQEDAASVSGTPHRRKKVWTTSANEEVVDGGLPIQRNIELSREVVGTAMDSDDTESMVSNNSLILAMECDLAAHVREEGPNVVHQAQGANAPQVEIDVERGCRPTSSYCGNIQNLVVDRVRVFDCGPSDIPRRRMPSR